MHLKTVQVAYHWQVYSLVTEKWLTKAGNTARLQRLLNLVAFGSFLVACVQY